MCGMHKRVSARPRAHRISAASEQHGGLATVYRDRTYLDMDEEQRAKRLLVISKHTTQGWIKTEAQAMVDRAKVEQSPMRYTRCEMELRQQRAACLCPKTPVCMCVFVFVFVCVCARAYIHIYVARHLSVYIGARV